ncbi:alpha/beta fold hydrolase [Cellulomonas sp. P22]|uniref:alpha/beta fold hydrolase n=1 Tax=Cellulomonas sp. P22 TaxID=3373189 RepID=UPI0037923B9B
MTGVAVKTAAVTGQLTLPYAEVGDPAGIDVVFVHGYVESWRYLEALLERLPPFIHGYAPTQRGHGDADRPRDGYRPADYAADLVAFMDAVGVRRAVLVGTSSGGLVAEVVAGSSSDRVSGLVLVSTPATLADKPGVAEMWETIARLEDPLDRAFVEGFVRATSPESLPEGVVDDLVDESLKAPARVWKGAMRGLIDSDATAMLDRITAPTLLIWGDHDPVVPRSDQDTIVNRIRGARLVVYPGAGHGVHLEQPDRVVNDLADFVAGLS